jgi:hypothetical protein
MKNYTTILEELAEIRTRTSIIGLACSRLVKKNMTVVIESNDFLTYLKMIDDSLTLINKHTMAIEHIVKKSD